MANLLKTELKNTAVAMLCEGNSIRSIERMTGIHRDTIMRLGVRIGEGCKRIMDEKMRALPCKVVEVDEIWGFVTMKEKTAKRIAPKTEAGDVWTWVALDAETKLVPAFAIGDRTQYMANTFIEDLAARLSNRVQISTDGLAAYQGAIERAFGCEVDYGSIIKTFSDTQVAEQRRYSPPEVVKVEKKVVQGEPDVELISTSYVEKQNHTLRMHCRRLSRLTNAFSKKMELQSGGGAPLRLLQLREDAQNHPLRSAVEAGVIDSAWTVADLVEMIEG